MKNIYNTIESEITSFMSGQIEISPGVYRSQYEIVKKISRYANRQFESGSKDSLGNDKYWFDVIQSRIEGERKNIDFDTKDIFFFSEISDDSDGIYLLNLANRQWMRDNDQSLKINEAIEKFSGWGNIVWKRVKDGYELKDDFINFYVINQAAKCLDDTPVIERHMMTQSDLRKKKGVWDTKAIEEVIKNCQNSTFQTSLDGAITQDFQIPYYEIFERNGEISVAELKEAKGEKIVDGDEYEFVLAKIVVAGLKQQQTGGQKNKYVLFADEISEMPYIEAHREDYRGAWWRVGMYELLFDIQARANEIGNQIAQGLRLASKTVYRSSEVNTLAENILTDLLNGDIVKSKDLQQVETRMNGLDQLIADWNRLMDLADRLCNSYEIVQGDSPAGQPFRLGALLNANANKLFGFMRQKIGIAVQTLFERWIIDVLIRDLKASNIIKVTGDSEYFNDVCSYAARGIVIAESLKQMGLNGDVPSPQALEEIIRVVAEQLKGKHELLITNIKERLTGLKPRVMVVITGENINREAYLASLATFIQLEQDPVKRSLLIDEAMKKQGINIPKLNSATREAQKQQSTQMMQQQMQNGQPVNGMPLSSQGADQASATQ